VEKFWMYFGIASFVFACVTVFLVLWKRRENRRYDSVELASKLREWGLDMFADLFLAYGVGNYAGEKSVLRIVRNLVSRIKDEGVPVMLGKLFWKLLAHFLTEDESRTRIKQMVEDADRVAARKPADPLPEPTIDSAA